MTSLERALVLRAADALADGDTDYAAELLEIVLDVPKPVDPERCPRCNRWPGQTWTCPHVRECARLAEAA